MSTEGEIITFEITTQDELDADEAWEDHHDIRDYELEEQCPAALALNRQVPGDGRANVDEDAVLLPDGRVAIPSKALVAAIRSWDAPVGATNKVRSIAGTYQVTVEEEVTHGDQ